MDIEDPNKNNIDVTNENNEEEIDDGVEKINKVDDAVLIDKDKNKETEEKIKAEDRLKIDEIRRQVGLPVPDKKISKEQADFLHNVVGGKVPDGYSVEEDDSSKEEEIIDLTEKKVGAENNNKIRESDNIIQLTSEEFKMISNSAPEDHRLIDFFEKNGITVDDVDNNVIQVEVDGSTHVIPTYRDYYLRLFDNVDKRTKIINKKHLEANNEVKETDVIAQYTNFLTVQCPDIGGHTEEWRKNVNLVSENEVHMNPGNIFIDTCIEGAKLAIEELERRKNKDDNSEINEKINKIINAVGKENL